jgi:hypothetical protein
LELTPISKARQWNAGQTDKRPAINGFCAATEEGREDRGQAPDVVVDKEIGAPGNV